MRLTCALNSSMSTRARDVCEQRVLGFAQLDRNGFERPIETKSQREAIGSSDGHAAARSEAGIKVSGSLQREAARLLELDGQVRALGSCG